MTGPHESTKFVYSDITSVTREINHLHFCRPEIAVRRYASGSYHSRLLITWMQEDEEPEAEGGIHRFNS